MSNTKDIQIYEKGGGGEMEIISEDLLLSETLYQTIYLALFGGNLEASTIGNEIKTQERFDYWANELLFSEEKSKQFNSETEKALRSTVLNPAGRLTIKKAVEVDLSHISSVANFFVDVSILNYNKVQITVSLENIPNQSNKVSQFIWDNAKKDLIIKRLAE